MFSVSTAVVLLVFFVSQAPGQSISTMTPNVTNMTISPSPTVVSSGIVSATPTLPSTEFTKPSEKTCAKLSVVIDKPWNDTYKDNLSDNFRNLSDEFSNALKKLFSDVEKYIDVEVNFTETEQGLVLASAKLCLVFKEGEEVFIEDEIKDKVKTGKLDTDLPVKEDSAEFEPLGVLFKSWNAKEGECEEKCEGAAGPFLIVSECQNAGYSCKGHKTTKKTDECTTYCSSTVAVSVSSVVLVIGIFLSSSFQ